MTMIILLTCFWLILGAFGHIYWWTKDFDYTTNMIPFTICVSIFLGPLSLIVGYIVHTNASSTTTTLFNKRK